MPRPRYHNVARRHWRPRHGYGTVSASCTPDVGETDDMMN